VRATLYDGHTLETVIPQIETQIGASLLTHRGRPQLSRPPDHKMKVYISGQKRSPIDAAIKRAGARRSSSSSATPRPSTEWIAQGPQGGSKATPPTPCWPPPATTSAALLRVFVMAATAATEDIPIPHATTPEHQKTAPPPQAFVTVD
jgi:hypothetical protein